MSAEQSYTITSGCFHENIERSWEIIERPRSAGPAFLMIGEARTAPWARQGGADILRSSSGDPSQSYGGKPIARPFVLECISQTGGSCGRRCAWDQNKNSVSAMEKCPAVLRVFQRWNQTTRTTKLLKTDVHAAPLESQEIRNQRLG